MAPHIDAQRLRDIAFRDDLLFTFKEFDHLRVCTECFQIWADLIRQALPEKDASSNKSQEI
jgi:hypothetical protein